MRHRHLHQRSSQRARWNGEWLALPGGGRHRPRRRLRLPARGAVRDSRGRRPLLPARGGVFKSLSRRCDLPATRVRYFWRTRRKLYQHPPAQRGDSHGHHAPHGARKARARSEARVRGIGGLLEQAGGDDGKRRFAAARGPRHFRGKNLRHPARHSRHPLRRSEFLQGPVRRGRAACAVNLRPALARQGHRIRHPRPSAHRHGASRGGLHHPRRHASEPPAARGRALPAFARGPRPRTRSGGKCDVREPLCGVGGVVRVHRRGGHLPHALLERITNHLGHALLLLRRGQSRGLDALLARRRTPARRPRRAGAVSRRGGDRHGGARDFRGPATPPRDEETSLPRRARNGLAGGRPGLRAGFR